MVSACSSLRLATFVGAAALFAGFFAGCASEPTLKPEPRQEPATATSPSTTSKEVEASEASGANSAQTAIPDTCDEVLPLATVLGYDSQLENLTAESDGESELASLIGPTTMASLQGGAQQLYCVWGIRESDGGARLGVATINESSKEQLLTALRDSVYEEIAPVAGAEAMFVQGQSDSHRYMDEIVVGGDLLLVSSHTISGNFARDAFSALVQ